MNVKIGKKEFGEIRAIAFRELMDYRGSIYVPTDRDKLLFNALRDWLIKKGIACEWTVDE